MSNYTYHDRTLALAGIYQVSKLIYDLATKGKYDETAYQASINSTFNTNPANTLDVFGNLEGIKLGLNTLLGQMGSDKAVEMRNIEITRYALSLVLLERSLAKTDNLRKIARVLETAETQRKHFSDFHENVIASLARAYTENLSVLKPLIMVKGQHGHLQNPQNANKIRALLLAGIRSTLLWRQVGGTRWQLLLSRKRYLTEAERLLF